MGTSTTDQIGGVTVPTFLYGTAWKEERTRALVTLAIDSGFRGIDTANQRRHYHEAGVGEAVAAAIAAGSVRREDLFLQTKFTFAEGQDQRLPYDPRAATAEQVRQSFASSLEHLQTSYLDSYVLHGPSQRNGLGTRDWDAWHAMEEIQKEGQTRLIGVSNVTRAQLEELLAKAAVPPAFVQNRCYAQLGWDREVRDVCRAHAVRYQGFSLLTANPHVLRSQVMHAIVARTGRTPAQVVFRFAMQVGMVPLTGTTDAAHMKQDLEVLDVLDVRGFTLEDSEVGALERG